MEKRVDEPPTSRHGKWRKLRARSDEISLSLVIRHVHCLSLSLQSYALRTLTCARYATTQGYYVSRACPSF